MSMNKQKLNPDKTEFLLIGNEQQQSKYHSVFPIELFGVKTYPAKSVRNLGVIFDKNFNFWSHISAIAVLFFTTSEICSVFTVTLIWIAYYCNSLLSGIADTDLAKLQRVQNWLARVVTKSPPLTHSVPLLCSLHWLPVKCRVDFNICLLTYKTLSAKQPVYLHSLLATPLPSRSLSQIKESIFLYLESRPMLGKGQLALVLLLFGTACHYQSVHPLQLPPSGNFSWHIFLTWPFSYRLRHAWWLVDLVQLLHRFCCWALIWMLHAGNIGAIEIWLIDGLMDKYMNQMNNSYQLGDMPQSNYLHNCSSVC